MKGMRVVAVALLVALAITPVAEAQKKKKGGGGAVDITKAVGAVIPDRAPGGPFGGVYGQLTSTIEVGKRFKGRRVRDVNVTVQTLGATGTNPADDLVAVLTAPNGASARLFESLEGYTTPESSIGPLTLDDESPFFLGGGPPIVAAALFQPWAGTAESFDPLALMDDGPVRGTWTLKMLDGSAAGGGTSVLSFWRLDVIAGRPYRTP
jgi:hypothetical protein